MAIVTERIPILVTAEQKARIARAAEAAGLSMGEYLRRAAGRRRLRAASGPARSVAFGGGLRAQATRRRSLIMGVTEKLWDALTTVIKMNDKIERLAGTVVSQQQKIEPLTERVIRLETVLEIALATRSGSRRIEHKTRE